MITDKIITVTDKTFGKALADAAAKAPEQPKRKWAWEEKDLTAEYGVILFAFPPDLSGREGTRVTIANERTALTRAKRNWDANNRHAGIRGGSRVDRAEQAVRCYGSCAATLDKIEGWIAKWEAILAEEPGRADLEECVKTQSALASAIRASVSQAAALMRSDGTVSPDGEIRGVSVQTVERMSCANPVFRYAWAEEEGRKLAEFRSRAGDIAKLTAAYRSFDSGHIYATCPDGAYAVEKYGGLRTSKIVERIALAYADALGDTSGLDALRHGEPKNPGRAR